MQTVSGVGPEADTANVHEGAGAGERAPQFAALEAGRGDDESREVAGSTHPRIVGDVGGRRASYRIQREVREKMLAPTPPFELNVTGVAVTVRQHSAFQIECTLPKGRRIRARSG